MPSGSCTGVALGVSRRSTTTPSTACDRELSARVKSTALFEGASTSRMPKPSSRNAVVTASMMWASPVLASLCPMTPTVLKAPLRSAWAARFGA